MFLCFENPESVASIALHLLPRNVKESLHLPSRFTATQVLTTHHSNNLHIKIGMYSRKRQPKQNFEDSRSRMDSALSLTLLSDLITAIFDRSLRKDRPCFDRGDGLADGRVLLDIDGSVDRLVPHGRLVRAVHHVDLHLHRPRQRRGPPVLRDRLQLVRRALFHAFRKEKRGEVRERHYNCSRFNFSLPVRERVRDKGGEND